MGAKVFGEGFGHEPRPNNLGCQRGTMVAEACWPWTSSRGTGRWIVTDQDGLGVPRRSSHLADILGNWRRCR